MDITCSASLGEHNETLLAELGDKYTDELSQLYDSGVISNQPKEDGVHTQPNNNKLNAENDKSEPKVNSKKCIDNGTKSTRKFVLKELFDTSKRKPKTQQGTRG